MRSSAILRRFVAYSIFAHVGAAAIWGLPSWLAHHAEHARAAEQQRLAEHFRAEEVKSKEHARESRIAKTRNEVREEMRKDLGKLVSGLPEKSRDELFTRVEDKTAKQASQLAEALGDPETPEQNLRNLETELRRDMVAELDHELTAGGARELADQFLDNVDSQVAPDLAAWMRSEIDATVAAKMKDEAAALIQQQREGAAKARDEATAQLREAITKGSAAAEAIKGGGDKAAQAEQDLAAADAAMLKAESAAAALGSSAEKAVGAAEAALSQAHAAVARAGAAAHSAQNTSGDAAAAAAAAADSSTAFVKEAQKARDAVAGDAGADRAAAAAAALRSAEAGLRAGVEKAFADDLAATTLPRLEKELKTAFAKELADDGLGDDAFAGEIAHEAAKRLEKSVPALAKVGDGVQARLDEAAHKPAGDAGAAAASAATADGAPGAAGTKDAQSAEGAAGAQGGRSGGGKARSASAGGDKPQSKPASGQKAALDQALAAGIGAIGSHAASGVGAVAGNAREDARMVARAGGKDGKGAGAAAALADMHDRVAAVARSMKNGRMGSAGGGTGIGGLRQGAVARGGGHRDEQAYKDISGKIAGRETVQGEHWAQQGAQGETAHAEAISGRPVPARVVGSPEPSAGSLALVNAEPYKPTFKSIAFISVPAVEGNFKVDGDLGKWQGIPAVALTPEGAEDKSPQSMRVAWSSAGVFLLFTIADPDHQLGKSEASNFWDADVAEIWIDAYNTKENHRARHSGQQFWIWPQGSASDPDLTGGESVMLKDGSYTPTAVRADKLERWATMTPAGWTLEARIPAASIADADLAPGRILGFNAYITTKTQTCWYWSAGKKVSTQSQPDTWGDLLLAGSDAKLTIGDGTDPSKTTAVVGEPVRITVTDGDMNLDPAARDKVMVTVKDGHGGQQIAVLEETAAASGIFEGSVSTALALDEPLPGALGVYEGERVDVVYIDQARANGARDAEVRASVAFASAVTAKAGRADR